MITKPIEIRVLKNLGNYKAGDLVKATVDENGKPLDKFWRQRLKDAKRDGCCEIVKPAVKKTVSRKSIHVEEENK
jgi:nucleotidyltransferase/DNA polymerase involved in DNA repair